ncbi:hypothetical protein BurJ1DRAFT_1691 [Burkholderiales bacterium JOSHI_001]|nr:hypothetical protein BurJ1DRAFT_1691 [Burkholderiales bacterium JOSHI_001]
MSCSLRWFRESLLLALLASLLGGCATPSQDIRPVRSSPESFIYWDCERLFDESDRVQQRAADLAYAVDVRVGNNMIALGLGVTVFWPALMAMRPDGLDAIELAELKGRHDALALAMVQRACGPVPQQMPPDRAAALPVAAGERLQYEERLGNGPRATTRLFSLTLAALRRDQLEFTLDLDGQTDPQAWRQDLAGNVLSTGSRPAPYASGVLGWRRLLRGPLELGQVLAGDLPGPDPLERAAQLRGQVVARGPQQLAGRAYNVAVIELFGDAPAGGDLNASTRLDGVMAVDVPSGVLLRLDLRCANPDFALRRRLLRVEAAAPR